MFFATSLSGSIIEGLAGSGKGFFAGVAEQFTHFGTLQEDGQKVPNDANQSLDSSITQVLLGYNFNEHFGSQVSVPATHYSTLRLIEDSLRLPRLRHAGDTAVAPLDTAFEGGMPRVP